MDTKDVNVNAPPTTESIREETSDNKDELSAKQYFGPWQVVAAISGLRHLKSVKHGTTELTMSFEATRPELSEDNPKQSLYDIEVVPFGYRLDFGRNISSAVQEETTPHSILQQRWENPSALSPDGAFYVITAVPHGQGETPTYKKPTDATFTNRLYPAVPIMIVHTEAHCTTDEERAAVNSSGGEGWRLPALRVESLNIHRFATVREVDLPTDGEPIPLTEDFAFNPERISLELEFSDEQKLNMIRQQQKRFRIKDIKEYECTYIYDTSDSRPRMRHLIHIKNGRAVIVTVNIDAYFTQVEKLQHVVETHKPEWIRQRELAAEQSHKE